MLSTFFNKIRTSTRISFVFKTGHNGNAMLPKNRSNFKDTRQKISVQLAVSTKLRKESFKLNLLYFNIVLNIIPTTLYEGYIVSVHRMVMGGRPVDPGSIQGSHRPISFKRVKHRTRANDIL